MTRTRTVVLASSTVLVLAGTAAAFASGSGHRRAAPVPTSFRSASVAFAPRAGEPRAGLPGPAGVRPGSGPFLGLRAAAYYLGIPVATLAADLRSGKTLAQVADSTSGKSASGLVDFLVAKVESALDEAVKAGRLTPAQKDSIVSMVRTRIVAAVNASPPTPSTMPDARPGFGFGVGLRGGLEAAADYLQVPVSSLVSDLRSGKSLADVANSTPGKSASGLIDALVADEKAALDTAVKAGRLTPAEEDEITANLEERVTALVNGTMPAPGVPFGHRFGYGHRHGWSEGHEQDGVNA